MFVLTMGGWPGKKGPRERGCCPPTSLKLRGDGRATNDRQGENEGNYSVSVRRTIRKREGGLQKLEQSRRLGMPWFLAWTSLEALQMIVQKYTKAVVKVNSRNRRSSFSRPRLGGISGGGQKALRWWQRAVRSQVAALGERESPSLRSKHGNKDHWLLSEGTLHCQPAFSASLGRKAL
jgi:hypothetical protein